MSSKFGYASASSIDLGKPSRIRSHIANNTRILVTRCAETLSMKEDKASISACGF